MNNGGKLRLVALMVAVMVLGLWGKSYAQCLNVSNVEVTNSYPGSITIEFNASSSFYVKGMMVWVYVNHSEWWSVWEPLGDMARNTSKVEYIGYGRYRIVGTGTGFGFDPDFGDMGVEPFSSAPVDVDKGFFISYDVNDCEQYCDEWGCFPWCTYYKVLENGSCSVQSGMEDENLAPCWPINIVSLPVDNDLDGYTDDVDCDDNDASIYPGAPELCDGKNNDCNDPFWPDLPVSEQDNDQDQFRVCEECDDSDSTIYPGAPELCDKKDNDCNGLIDETIIPPDGNLLANQGFESGDGNGWTPTYQVIGDGQNQVSGYDFVDYEGRYYVWQILTGMCQKGVNSGGLYQDVDVTAYNNAIDQGMVTVTADGLFQRWQSWDDRIYLRIRFFDVNNNQIGLLDSGLIPATFKSFVRHELNGSVPVGTRTIRYDVYGELAVGCAIDCGFDDAHLYLKGITPQGCDKDGDGYYDVTRGGDDCNDFDNTIYPGASEGCNGVDNNCDGAVPADEVDADKDGIMACSGDCDDFDNSIYPGATEVCNGIDDDCDGKLPDTEADNDHDSVMACSGDCNDFDNTVYSGATESCDGKDNDCDGIVDENFPDNDKDGTADCVDPDDDNDGVLDTSDSCPLEDATGFDADGNGCIDTLSGLSEIVNTLTSEEVIAPELQSSLLSKVDNAEKSADKENICAAVNKLEALISQTSAQRDKKISNEAVDLIIAYANNLIKELLNRLPSGDTC